jgi:hypothetical protein
VKTFVRNAFAVVAAGALSACGGGSQSKAVPVPTATVNGASQGRTPVGNVTLTIKRNAGFHTAKSVRNSASSKRRPAYVNSGNFFIDVWVVSGGFAVHAVDSTGGSNTNGNGDGSSTFTIPVFTAVGPSYIVAYETDQSFQSGGNLLAIGEADLSGLTPGSAPQLSLTMLMYTQHIGVMSDPVDGNGDSTVFATSGAPFTLTNSCSPAAAYFFAADAQSGFIDPGSFVNNAGIGGVSQPILTGTSASGIVSQSSSASGGYMVYFGSCVGGQVNVTLTAANPAYALATDAINSLGSFPGIDYLYQNGSSTDQWFQTYMSSVYYGTGSTVSTPPGGIGLFAPNLP